MCVRGPDFRVSRISGAANYQQDYLAVVRGRSVGMDNLLVVLSARSVGRIWLRVHIAPASVVAIPGRHARDSGRDNTANTPDNTGGFMETD